MIVTLLGLKKDNTDSINIFFNFSYSSENVERTVRIRIKKLYKSFKREVNVKFTTHYKLQKFCSLQLYCSLQV